MNVDNIILDRCNCGGIIIAEVIPGGIIPLIHFQNFSELERFAMGLLGWCEHFQPKVPKVFLEAWAKEGKDAC